MQRDYSPTYWFRIRRAEQLLALYRRDPASSHARQRVQERLCGGWSARRTAVSVWLKKDDLVFRTATIFAPTGQEIGQGAEPAGVLWLRLKLPGLAEDFLGEASPAAIGTLVYVAYETRRLYEEMGAKGKFHPLEVTALVEPGITATGMANPRRWPTPPARYSTSITPRCPRPNWSACASCSATLVGPAISASWKTA